MHFNTTLVDVKPRENTEQSVRIQISIQLLLMLNAYCLIRLRHAQPYFNTTLVDVKLPTYRKTVFAHCYFNTTLVDVKLLCKALLLSCIFISIQLLLMLNTYSSRRARYV